MKRIKLFEQFIAEEIQNDRWVFLASHGAYYKILDGALVQCPAFDGDDGSNPPKDDEEAVVVSKAAFTDEELAKFAEEVKDVTGWEYGKDYTIEDVPAKVEEAEAPKKYWMGHVGKQDDFGDEITDEFIDGKTKMGPWANMTPKSWKQNGCGKLGTGYGQRYKKQDDGKWLKVEG